MVTDLAAGGGGRRGHDLVGGEAAVAVGVAHHEQVDVLAGQRGADGGVTGVGDGEALGTLAVAGSLGLSCWAVWVVTLGWLRPKPSAARPGRSRPASKVTSKLVPPEDGTVEVDESPEGGADLAVAATDDQRPHGRGQVPAGTSSASSRWTRMSMSSRMRRTTSTGWPAGSSSSQSS